jgi:hypothetical protein
LYGNIFQKRPYGATGIKNYNDKQNNTMKHILTTMLTAVLISITPQAKAQISNLTQAQVDSKTYTLSQRGDVDRERSRTRMIILMMSCDATGYSIKPGESVTVTVTGVSGTQLPRILFQSFEGNEWGSWMNTQNLTSGTQTITLPASHPGPAAIFFRNEFLPSEQAGVPVVTIGGDFIARHPIYIHGETNPAAFKAQIDAYSGNNIAVAVSENAVITTSATGMKSGLDLTHDRGYTIANVMNAWEKLYYEFNTTLSAFDMDAPFGTENSRRGGKMVATSFAAVGYPHGGAAGAGFTGYSSTATINKGGAGTLVNYPESFHEYVIAHELGHQWEPMDLRVTNGKNADGSVNWGASEVTNLVHQEYGQYISGASKTTFDDRWGDPYGQGAAMPRFHVERYELIGTPDRSIISRSEQNTLAIAIYQILMAYDYAAFGRAAKDVRMHPEKYTYVSGHSEANSPARWENLVLSLSNAVGRDLTSHFAHYNVPVSEAAKQKAGVDKLPKDERKTWYIATFKNRQPESSAFTKPGVDVTRTGTTINIMNATANELLCYEVHRGGKLVQVIYPLNGQTQVTWSGLQTEDVITAYDRILQPHTNYVPDLRVDITGAVAITVNGTYTYTGNPIEPTDVTVKLGNEVLVAEIDYTLSYIDNINVGSSGRIIVKGTGNFKGEASTSFSIGKSTPPVPSAPTVESKTATSVTLTAIAGFEYFRPGRPWQQSNTFSGLTAGTTYTFQQRQRETANTRVSEISEGLAVTTYLLSDKCDIC